MTSEKIYKSEEKLIRGEMGEVEDAYPVGEWRTRSMLGYQNVELDFRTANRWNVGDEAADLWIVTTDEGFRLPTMTEETVIMDYTAPLAGIADYL